MRILKKKEKRNKGKTDIEEREQKRVSVQKTREIFKKETFFQKKKREKGKHAKTCIFLFTEKLTKKWKDQKRRSFQMRVLERGHRQRKQEEKKETTDEPMDELKEDTKR